MRAKYLSPFARFTSVLMLLGLPLVYTFQTAWSQGDDDNEISVEVTITVARLYNQPREGALVVLRVSKGTELTTDGVHENGFLKILTENQKPVWIRMDDTDFEVASQTAEVLKKANYDNPDPSRYPRYEWDGSFALGRKNSKTFFEYGLGVGTRITHVLTWRNGPFYRLVDLGDSYFGWDTSGRYVKPVRFGGTPVILGFFGPGFRLGTLGPSVPFLETGFATFTRGVSARLNLKALLISPFKEGASNELLFSVFLTGEIPFLND